METYFLELDWGQRCSSLNIEMNLLKVELPRTRKSCGRIIGEVSYLNQLEKDAPKLWHLLQFNLWALEWKSPSEKKLVRNWWALWRPLLLPCTHTLHTTSGISQIRYNFLKCFIISLTCFAHASEFLFI
jgi:hypothetical protein